MTMEGDGCWGGGGRGGGDLFICFSLRRSMRNPPLSSSLSRRLRNSGNVKVGQSSAMFLSIGGGGGESRKKGSGFEAVEPSSPKVTCIGQVRVKTSMRRKKKKAVATISLVTMAMKRSIGDLKDEDLREKKVFVRVDLNVPLDANHKITDDSKVRTTVPTIKYLLEHGGKVILSSHLARNNARIVISGSLTLFSNNEYATSEKVVKTI